MHKQCEITAASLLIGRVEFFVAAAVELVSSQLIKKG